MSDIGDWLTQKICDGEMSVERAREIFIRCHRQIPYTPITVSDAELRHHVQSLEMRKMCEALGKTGGKVEPAAKLLGICRKTFISKMRVYGITPQFTASEAA